MSGMDMDMGNLEDFWIISKSTFEVLNIWQKYNNNNNKNNKDNNNSSSGSSNNKKVKKKKKRDNKKTTTGTTTTANTVESQINVSQIKDILYADKIFTI